MARTKKEENKEIVFDTESIKKELMAYVDSHVEERLEKVLDLKIRNEIIEEIDKANKKVLKEKNRKILFKNMLLIFFFGIILLLLYLLYQEDYFDSYFIENKKEDTPVVEKNDNKNSEVNTPTLEELKEKYGSYLDSYALSNDSSYVEDFYNGKLTNELKSYYTLSSLDFDKLEVEEDYQVLDQNDFLEACSKLFLEKCSLNSFEYNGNKIRYFQKLESFVSDSLLEKEDSPILRDIVDIQVTNNKVVITTLEGMIFDNQLYSVFPYEVVGEYLGDGFLPYAEHLNKMVYTFQDKKLVSIEKGL